MDLKFVREILACGITVNVGKAVLLPNPPVIQICTCNKVE